MVQRPVETPTLYIKCSNCVTIIEEKTTTGYCKTRWDYCRACRTSRKLSKKIVI